MVAPRAAGQHVGPYTCKDCRVPYARSDMFWVNKNSPAGQCRPCRAKLRKGYYRANRSAAKAYALDWKRRNPHKVTEYGRRRRHGLEPADYDAMYDAQGGACAVCGRTDEPLNVDHCHSSLKIRGLLCDRCNRGLGYFADKPELLRNAATYLEASRS